ncbi:MAG: GEVED domain-containing protein [Bacteroidetes bacterium]|nr:GEVED domain-containing protein [Bacteroidota bacterium]
MPILYRTLSFCAALICVFSLNAQDYKAMMEDPTFSIAEVKQAAETWFEENGKGEGSGYKGFQRWLWSQEYRFGLDGNRANTDPYFAEKQFEQIQAGMQQAASSSWQDFGPYAVDSITGHYSPGLGRVECFYFDPNDLDYLYLGSRSGGFWKSTDGGQSWSGSSTEFLVATGVNTMAVSPTNRDSVLINLRNARNGTSHGIYRSIDGGLTWSLSAFNPTAISWTGLGNNGQVYQLAYHPTIKDRVYVGTNEGLYISNDNLQTWTRVVPNANVTHIQFHPSDSAIVYIYDDYHWGANGNYILVSQDGGLTFSQSDELINNSGSNVEIAVSPDCPDCLFAASANGVWKSFDKGLNFTFMTNPAGVCDGFAVSDMDTSVMIYGMLDVYRSFDGGRNFNKVANWFVNGGSLPFNGPQYVHADLREIRAHNGEFYIGTDGYLAKSSNSGIDWQRLSRGTGIREFYSIGLSQSEHYSTMAGSQDNGTSIYRKEGWVEFYGADGMESLIHPLNPEWMMGSVQYGTRRLTFDAGRSQRAATPTGQSGAWEAPLERSSTNHMKLYHFGEDVYESEDFGLNWNQIGSPLFTDETVRAAIAPNDGNIIAVSRQSSLELSFNGGNTFRLRSTGLPSASITDVTFAPHSDSIIVVTYATHQNNGQKVFISYDQGLSWSNITANLGDMPIRSVVIDHSPDHNIYLGAEIGVYVKPMQGSNWSLYNAGLPNMSVTDLEIMYGANLLRAATWGRGMWQISLKDRVDYPKIIHTEMEHRIGFQSPTDVMSQHVQATISYARSIDTVYLQWSANGLGLDSIIGMVFQQDSTWQTIEPIPAQAKDSDLYFKIIAVGDQNDTSITFRYHYRVQGEDYCLTGNDPADFTDAYIDEVQMSNIQNISSRSPYSDFTSNYINLNTNQSYTLLVVTVNPSPTDVVRAWIDFDGDSAFSPSEQLNMSALDPLNSSFVTINLPQFSNTDTVRMRVRVMPNYLPADACNYYGGEAEDYSVVLIGNGLSLSEWEGPEPKIYPNPASEFLNIEAKQLDSYRILNANGQELKAADLNRDQISLKDLGSGTYIIELHHQNGQFWRSTFIKN